MQSGGLLEHALGLLRTEMAHGIDDPKNRDAELALSAQPAALGGLHDQIHVQPGKAVEDAEGEVHLGVAHPLRREVAHHVVGDGFVVGRSMQAFGDGFEAHQKAGKVGVAVDRLGLLESERNGIIYAGELHQGLGRDRALEVQVQLRFG